MKKYRVGFAGLVHDHIWGEMENWKGIADAEFVAAGDPNAPLLEKAKENEDDERTKVDTADQSDGAR